MKKGNPPIVVSATFPNPIEEVWQAITDHDKMVEWYFDKIPEFRPEIGFETEFLIENEGRQFLHKWKILDVILNKMIKYTWYFEGYAGDGYVVFDLSGNSELTKLTVTTVVTEDFPDDIPEFKRESCKAGWEYFIQGRLTDYLAKN